MSSDASAARWPAGEQAKAMNADAARRNAGVMCRGITIRLGISTAGAGTTASSEGSIREATWKATAERTRASWMAPLRRAATVSAVVA